MQVFVIVETKGKQAAWMGALKEIGLQAEILVTHGAIKSFPSSLWPLGIGFSEDGLWDQGRSLKEGRFEAIAARLLKAGHVETILIATDDDTEGDVTALDLTEALITASRPFGKAIRRVRTQALTPKHIKRAIDEAQTLLEASPTIIDNAIPGRARALTDRWIGAVFSREAVHPVGRVRTAILGSFFLLEKAQQHLRGRPEIGEIILRARSSSGGLPFVARVALDGSAPKARIERLQGLAEAYAGRMVPGAIMPRQSLSAAVAGRIGNVRPFNTGDAVAYAIRHFKLSGAQAMAGLQGGHLRGLLSYPKTESRELSREAAVQIVHLGEACRFANLDVEALSQDFGPSLADADREKCSKGSRQQAIHPVCAMDKRSLEELDAIIRAPIRFTDMSGSSTREIEDIMIAIVSRRCLEAARDIALETGDWRPDNERSINAGDAEILAELDWLREAGTPLPWSKDLMTGAKLWPLRSVIVDMMMQEGLGRSSSFGAQADMMERSGELLSGDLLNAPRPSELGRAALGRSPRVFWLPATCRMIDQALSNDSGLKLDDRRQSMRLRMNRRVAFWLKQLPEDVQSKLILGIEDPDAITGRGPRLISGLQNMHSPGQGASDGFEDRQSAPDHTQEFDDFGMEQICL